MDDSKDTATTTLENYDVLAQLMDLANPQPKYRTLLEMGGYGVKCKCIFLMTTVLSRQHIDSIRMASCRLLMAERKLEPSCGFNYQVGGTGVI